LLEQTGLIFVEKRASCALFLFGNFTLNHEVKIASAFFEVLLKTERSSEAELNAHQGNLLTLLVQHALANVPFYKDRASPNAPFDANSDYWRSQPFMSRKDLAGHFADLRARDFSIELGPISPVQTGGSTGPAARRDLSSLESLARLVCSYRMFVAWELDQSKIFYVIRKPRQISGTSFDRWGHPWLRKETLGVRRRLDIFLPASEQLKVLAQEAPVYVNTLPSNILRLAVEARCTGLAPRIPFIVSVAEFLPVEVIEAAREVFGSRIINVLSSAEGGVIAIECPESGLFHIQSEQVLAEIIRKDGSICEEGEVGELVVTPLYSYATPLLRYRSGDYVEKGPKCSCGRNLPTISRILGRKEHMFHFPDGTRKLPAVNRVKITEILGHDSWVLVQIGPVLAELRIGHSPPDEVRAPLLELATQALGNDFKVEIKSVDSLPPTSGGKRHFTLNSFDA
jgi:phenylacetate-CoA ligase